MKLSIVIPALNEEKRIGKTLEAYSKYFGKLQQQKVLDFEIRVVLNECTDSTPAIVKQYQKKYKHIVLHELPERGKGLAIIHGFSRSLKNDWDLIGFVDADMATSPEAYHDLVRNIKDHDGIIASRYVPGAQVFPKQSVSRIVASRIFNLLIKTLLFLPYKDTQCGAKIFKRNAVSSVLPHLDITKWAFDVNLLYLCKKHNFLVKEHPTVWTDKEYSVLNIHRAGPQMFLSIVRLRLLNSPFKKLVRWYDRLPDHLKFKLP